MILSFLREGDSVTSSRLAKLLYKLSGVIDDLKEILLAVRQGCDPNVFYNDIRPWLSGQDPDRPWTFEGLERNPELKAPTELSGATAGQDPLIQTLDIFLGVNSFSHSFSSGSTAADNDAGSADSPPTFWGRMQSYMPRQQRVFLRHLASPNRTPQSLRALVTDLGDTEVNEAYNRAVLALKEFRDAHIRIVTIYVLGPLRRLKTAKVESSEEDMDSQDGVKGTGGTDMVKFLKGVRDLTSGSIVSSSPGDPSTLHD